MRSSRALVVLFGVVVCCQLAANNAVQAGQGCPFDDGSCQEYCSQQGCNMGYCGHFAWIQCICRKCGDEWSWYDKVHYNPDKTVNQTELDSLKLNATSPLILTNSQQLSSKSSTPAATSAPTLTSSSSATSGSGSVSGSARGQADDSQKQQQQQQRATLTTLLIPDLSDNSKLDLNDIPDENSEKFLDYLAKNHERLVQATSKDSRQQQQQQREPAEDQPTTEEAAANESTLSSLATADDETVEIQITSNNNNASATDLAASQQQTKPSTSESSSTSSSASTSAAASVSSEAQLQAAGQEQQPQKSHLIRLLHMASEEQLFDGSEQ